MHELAQERPRWGWRRLFIVMRRREGHDVGETRFLRIYRDLRLQVRARKKRKVNYVRGVLIAPVSAANERWSLDFMHDCRRRCKLPRLGRCKNPYPVPPIGGLVRLTSLAISVV
jgi:hypothetical protein